MLGPIELVIVACLTDAPGECREHRLRLLTDGAAETQCLYGSPPRVARWALSHPGWRVKSWRCALAEDGETI